MRATAMVSIACAVALGACKQDARPAPPAPEAGAAAVAEPAAGRPDETSGVPAAPRDDAEIRRVFAEYRTAVERADGGRAAALLDRDTLAFYQRMHEAALAMPGDEVRARPLVERLTIVAMRAGRTRAELTAMSTRDVLAAAITQGNGASTVRGVELTDIVVDGDRARATPRKGGLALPIPFHFRRDDGGWRFDLTQLLAGVGEIMKTQLRGMSEDDLIRAYVASVGAPVDETMWEPPP